MAYSIDTSALMDAGIRWYPPDVFPTLWLRLEGLIEVGSLLASQEVLVELEEKDDDLHKWGKANPVMFVPLDETIQSVATEILGTFPRLVDSRKNRTQADPFVIALAKVRDLTVVTGEKNDGTLEKPKIPIVCSNYQIRCIGTLEFIREQGWSF